MRTFTLVWLLCHPGADCIETKAVEYETEALCETAKLSLEWLAVVPA